MEKARILVVDDNEAGRYAMARCLRESGHDVVEAQNGEECLKLAVQGQTDLILLDVKLPDISGIEVCKLLKADPRTALIPVIQVSAWLTRTQDRIEGLESGADEYLNSPFEPRELLAHVTHLLRLREAEERLRASEEFSRSLVQNTSAIIVKVDPQTRITYANARALEFFGYSEKELLGREAVGAIIPEQETSGRDLARMVQEIAKHPNRFHSNINENIRKNGERVWIEWSNSGIYDRQGRLTEILAVGIDITERMRAQEALGMSEERLQLALKASSAGAWAWDAQTNQSTWDERFQDYYGWGPNEPRDSSTWLERVHPEDRPRLRARIEEMLKTPGDDVWSMEFRVMHPTLGERWHHGIGRAERDPTGRVRQMAGIDLDITERKRAAESEERLRALMNHNPSLVFLKDEEGRYVFVNEAYQREFVLGKDWHGKTDFDFWTRQSAELFRADDAEVLRSGETRQFLEDSIDLSGRRWCWLCYKFPFTDSKGNRYLGGIGINVTDRVRAEEAVRESEEQFRRAIEDAPIPVIMHAEDGQVLQISRTWTELTGYTLADVPTVDTWLNRAYGEGAEEVRRHVHELFKSGKRAMAVEFPIRTQEGRTRYWSLSSSSPGTLRDGRRFVVAMAVDITERKQAEEALRESELFHRQTLESIPGMVFTTRADGNCDYQSQQWVDYTGVPMSEHLGAGWNKLLHPDDQPRALACWKAAVEGRAAYDLEYRVRRRDGEYEWFKVIGRPIRNQAGEIVRWLGVAANIHELKQTAEALRGSEERFRAVFESTSDCILVWDREYNYLYANQAAIDHVGTTRDNVIGKNIRDGLGHVPDFMELWMRRVDRAFATGESFRVEDAVTVGDRVVHSESQISPIRDTAGNVFAVGVVYRDVTERKKAEAAVRQAEERLRTVLKATGVGLWLNEMPLGRLNWDARTRDLFFLQPEEEVTMESFMSRLHPDDRERTRLEVEAALRGNRVYAIDHRAVDPATGRVRWIHSEGKGIYDLEGKLLRFDGVNYDITERKAFQEELERLVAERTARLQELVGELEHFSYTITHDMRAPLRAMQGFAEITGEALAAGRREEAEEFLRRIKISAGRMDGLITDALNFSRAVRNELPVGPIDVGRLLRGMLDTYPEFQGGTARIVLERDIPLVMGNDAGLTQCFSNLLGNALKFAKPGEVPEIRIWSEYIPGKETQGSSLPQPPEWVRLWVEDNGIGISAGLLPRVFDMFARGASPAAGTGIGLALVRKVVDRMGGRVGVESEQGKGSRFWVDLRPGDVRRSMAHGH